MVDHSFPKQNRLRTQKDFCTVYSKGEKFDGEYFTFYLYFTERGAAGQEEDEPRIGISVSSQVGKAVERNRIKRLVREAFRKNKGQFDGYDFIVVPKENIEGVENEIIREAFLAEFRNARKSYEEGNYGPEQPEWG